MRSHFSEEWYRDILAKHGRVRDSTDARRTTVTSGSSCEAAIQQTKSRRGESAPSPIKSRSDSVRVEYTSYPAPFKSKLEEAWANYLHLQVQGGEIASYWYEPLNLRLLGKKNFYKPDFLVLAGNGLTFYEIKGFNRSDDRSLVKMKMAAGLNPWARFVLVKRIKGEWVERVIE